MTATFTLTPADFVRLQKVVARRFRQKVGAFSWQFLMRVLVWLCIGLAGATYARVMREFPEIARPLELVAYLLAAALVVIVAMPYVSQASMRKHMLAPNGAFLSPQTITLSPESISVGSSRGNTVLPWSGVLACDEDETNYYLFIDAMQALVLPRTAIAPAAAEFEQYTRHLKSAA
jgi:hypothetical protein